MWPLLALSMLSLVLILERLVFFGARRYRFGKSLREGMDGQIQQGSSNPLHQVIIQYQSDLSQGEEHALNLSGREAMRQLSQHERGLKVLATIGAIAPLVGLLGTVWGMVKAFAQMAAQGAEVSPADFADGIWTGLLTTVAGLLVAIPAVVAARMFEAQIDKLAAHFNELASHLKERHFPS